MVELQALVYGFDAAIAKARFEVERNALFFKIGMSQCVARHKFGKLQIRLQRMMPLLTGVELRKISEQLLEPLSPAKPHFQTWHETHRSLLRAPEKFVIDQFCGLIADVQTFAAQLACEAELKQRSGMEMTRAMTVAMKQRASLATAMFRSRPHDDAGDVSPEYERL